MSHDIRVHQGSGNVFEDLRFGDEEAKEELLKAELGAEIFRILQHHRLTQTKAAKTRAWAFLNSVKRGRIKAGPI